MMAHFNQDVTAMSAKIVRVEARFSPEIKQLAESAATISGLTVTDYLAQLVAKNAPQIIEDFQSLELWNQDFDNLIAYCELNKNPNLKLQTGVQKLLQQKQNPTWQFSPLTQPPTLQFDCGKALLNQFLQRSAHKYARHNLSQTMVLYEAENPNKIMAYYTLARAYITRAAVGSFADEHYPLPVVLLAKLAVAQNHQGQGLGALCLMSALENAQQLILKNPAKGVVLAADADASGFYRQFGFFNLSANPAQKLFLTEYALKQLFTAV